MKFTKDANGNLVLTEEQFTAALEEQATKAVEELKKQLKLDELPPPPLPKKVPGDEDEDLKAKFAEKPNEKPHETQKRIEEAIVAIKGGKLRLEDAPKQIKLIRFIKSLYNNDNETYRALVGKALTEGSAADGGNLVFPEIGTDLLVTMEEYGIIPRDATVHNMTSNKKELMSVTTKPTVTRKGELVASDEAGTKFGNPELTVDKYMAHQIISLEELEDSNIELYSQMLELFGEQFAYVADYEGLAGSYYPGVLQSVTPTRTELASTKISEVLYKEAVACKNSLSKGKLLRGGKWYMHRTILGLFEGMEDQQGRPIVTNPFGPAMPALLGYPVELSEAMPALSDDAPDKSMIIFGNLKWVAYGRRKDITADLLKEGTLPKSGGGTVNLASEGAIALRVHNRFGINVTVPANLATMKTKAAA